MQLLGPVVLSFAFHIFSQRHLLRRHAAEILGCALGASLFSLLSTTLAGRLLELPPPMTLAIAPRSVTVALAMPIALQLGVPPALVPICAAAVVLTGLIGASTAQRLLSAAGIAGEARNLEPHRDDHVLDIRGRALRMPTRPCHRFRCTPRQIRSLEGSRLPPRRMDLAQPPSPRPSRKRCPSAH